MQFTWNSQLHGTIWPPPCDFSCNHGHSHSRTQVLLVHRHRRASLQFRNKTKGETDHWHHRRVFFFSWSTTCTNDMTHNGHLLILLHAPSLEEALTNFVYGKDKLAANSAYVEVRTGLLKVAHCRLCCTAQPREAKILVFGTAPTMPQSEPPHEHA